MVSKERVGFWGMAVLIVCLPLFSSTAQTPPDIGNAVDAAVIPYTSFGRGSIESVMWFPDNQRLFISTPHDAWIYGLNLEERQHLANVSFARLNRDGRSIAEIDDAGLITIWNADTLEVAAVLSRDHPRYQHRALEWSPNGRFLAHAGLCRTYCVEVWNAETFESVYSLDRDIDDIAWSPDGRFLALIHFHTPLILILDMDAPVLTGWSFEPDTDHAAGRDTVVWEDETHLDYYSATAYDSNYRMTRIDATAHQVEEPVETPPFFRPPNAHGFALTGYEQHLQITRNGEVLSTLSDVRTGHAAISAFEWNAAGSRLAFGTVDAEPASEAEVMILNPYTDTITDRFGGLTSAIRLLRWSPDDRFLFAADNRQQFALYDTLMGKVTGRSNAHTLVGAAAAWRPGGDQIVVADTLNSWGLWDSHSWNRLASPTTRLLTVPITDFNWQPNGKLFLASGRAFPYSSEAPSGLFFDPAHPNEDPLPNLTASLPLYCGVEAWSDWQPHDGTLVFLAGCSGHEQTIIWDVETDSLRRSVPLELRHDVETLLRRTRLSPSGRYFSLMNSLPGFSSIQELSTGTTTSGYGEIDDGVMAWRSDDSIVYLSWRSPARDPREHFTATLAVSSPIGADAVGGMVQPQVSGEIAGFAAPVAQGFLSAQGRYAAILDTNHQGMVVDTETRSPLFMLSYTANIIWSPDDAKLVVQRTDGRLWLMEANGAILSELDRPSGFKDAAGAFVWSSDGDHLAWIYAGYLLVWDVQHFVHIAG